MLRRVFNALYDKLLSRLGLALLALALLVNIGALLAVDAGVRRVEEAAKLAVVSRNVTTEILAVQSMLYEAESAQRGFLYTQNDAYLQPLDENEAEITSRFAKLREMVMDNSVQQKRLDQVRRIAMEKLVDLNKTIAIQKMGQKDAARALVMSNQGKQLMADIDAQILQFLSQEALVLQERIQKGAGIQLATRWGFAAILFINALMILACAVAVMRGMAREVDRDRADLVRHDEREAAELVRHDEREAAELVRHDEREAAEVVQQDKREAAELVRHDEREAVTAAEVVEREAELRALTVHLLRIQEEERRHVARELHDELGGTLSAIKLDIIMGRDAASKRNDEKSVARLQRAVAAIDSGIQFVRRLIENLRPTLLDNLGFEAALREMTEQFCERTSIKCVVSIPEGELNLTSAQSTTLYRVCQEALTNVMKYAKAKQVTITLTSEGSLGRLVITDDGVGLAATKQHRSMSHGLLGMRERMVALGGTFDIRGAAGCGTTLTATFPVVDKEQGDAV